MHDLNALRTTEFAALANDGGIYLNTASTGAMPARAIEALARFNALRATPHRMPPELEWGTLDRARRAAAALVGATPEEIALGTNTSAGLNLAAMALPFAPGDVVLTPEREYPANVYPWRLAASRRGIVHRFVPLADGLVDEDALIAALDAPRVRALSVSWVHFYTGQRLDLARLGSACRERGIWFVVDAIQGLGPCALDLAAVPVDVLACGAQKWLLGPWGTGFTYVRRAHAESLEPHLAGWLALEGTEDLTRLLDYGTHWRPNARRFEVNTHPAQDFAAFAESAELLLELGNATQAHVRMLTAELLAALADVEGARVITPVEAARRAGIVTVVPHDLAAATAALRAREIAFSLREGAVRVAPYLYNTRAEMREVAQLLARPR